MGSLDFPIEFHSKVEFVNEKQKQKAVQRLFDLKADHTDMVGATITVDQVSRGETPHFFEAKVVIYMRPDRVVAVEKADAVETALKGALDAIERQVRERRAKLKEVWKRPDLDPDQSEHM